MKFSDFLTRGRTNPDGTISHSHPLETEAGIRELQKTIAAAQPAVLLDDICAALESGFEAGLDHTALRRALRMLDGGAQKTVADLMQAVLRGSSSGLVPEVPAAAVMKYSRRIGVLCQRVLDAPGGESATVQAQGSDVLIAVRAARAWVLRKKLLRMSYRFPEEEFWEGGNRLYLFAQSRELLGNEAEPYPGEGPSSVMRERLTGLMFDMAPHAGMAPAQMECLDLLLYRYSAGFVERTASAPEAPFFIDIARPQPPQRWLPGLPVRSSMRFFGPGDCAAKIAALAAQAAGADKVPAWAERSGCTMDAYRLVLTTLGKHWSDQPPQRRERRVAANANIFLVNSFDDTRRAVAAGEDAQKLSRDSTLELKGDLMRNEKYFDRVRFGSVNPDKTSTGKLLRKQLVMPKQVLEKRERADGRPQPENSALADTSESGIGVALAGRAPWARVGVLVGYRAPDSMRWEVAIVRRLVRGVRLSLGLERLKGVAGTVRLMHVQGAAATGIEAREAIFISEPASQLITAKGECAAGNSFTVFTGGGQFSCRIAHILEQGPDFVLAAIEKTAPGSGARLS